MFNRERSTPVEDKAIKPATFPYAPTPSATAAGIAQRANPETPAPRPPAPDVTTVSTDAGSKLIVGPNIKLKGVEITDCDTLVVEGHVEATMDSRAIQIAQSGSFNGTAGIDVAEIHGRFTGELTVRKRLVIHATGKVSGNVRYGKLVIEEGGELSGDVKTLGAEEPRRATALPNRPAPH
jgi:cytoskeletal protein CcmA (bactofilin family)